MPRALNLEGIPGEALPLRVVLVLVTGIDPNLWDLRIPVLAHLPGHQRAIDLERILGEIGSLTASSTDASYEKLGGREEIKLP